MSSKNVSKSFNYRITEFFLGNNRLTVLSLILLLFFGIFATLSLKTTGFPNPEIKFLQIVAVYPGAASETVVKNVTQPIETAIKSIPGVKTFSSTTTNSVAGIGITIDDSANTDNVRNKIDAAVRSVKLPAGVETPQIITPSVSGADFYFTVMGTDKGQIYEFYNKAKQDLLKFPETSSVDPVVALNKNLVVTLNIEKMRSYGISVDNVKTELKSVDESLPVTSDTTLDGKSQTIVTQNSVSTVDNIKNINFSTPQGNVKLSDFSSVEIKYNFENDNPASFGYRVGDSETQKVAVTFAVKGAKGTDLAKYSQEIQDKFKSYNTDKIGFVTGSELQAKEDKTLIVEVLSQKVSNDEQVSEVVGGLIGGTFKNVEGPQKYLGWVFGGIQLIFLVMLAFVSWRAALVATFSIPLSLIFANIFLYVTGHDLNTLTLFSLVLVLGLVVDPTLVVLEAIQRKIDTGLKGKEASLEAIRDVGNGLFLATMVNIIVFVPFAILSGVLGQIFAYIPLTIIPALVGSYIIPLVFLAWIGGLILKKDKKKTNDEEKNLWPLAQWLIKTNTRILNWKWYFRLLIITMAFIIPFSIAGYYFSSGKIKSVQFASSDDGLYLQLEGTFLPSVSKEDRAKTTSEVVDLVTKTKGVQNIFQISDGVSYYINLQDKKDRPNLKATQISDNINKSISDSVKDKFFDISSDVIQTGPPGSNYQVSLSVKTDSLVTLENTSKNIRITLLNICYKNRVVTIDEKCDGGNKIVTKVDDGYTGKDNKVVEILLDQSKIAQLQLSLPNIPVTAIVNSQIRQLFKADSTNYSSDDSVGKVYINGEEINIMLDKNYANPTTIDQIKNLVIFSPVTGQSVKLSDIATVKETAAKASIIRIKGETVNTIQARLEKGNDDQGTAALVTTAITDYYTNNNSEKALALGVAKDAIGQFSEGDTAGFVKSFQELISALLLSIILIYIILALFFRSFGQPIVILFAIPLTFIGVFPALSAFTGGQFGFLEIIGLIILTGLVVNVAIFLIDAARQRIIHDGWDDKRAIAYASGLRLRPVLLTKFTAIASLLPLALFSEFYRSIAVVIMFGLLTSGFTSLFTTPILFIFFRSLSRKSRRVVGKIFRRH